MNDQMIVDLSLVADYAKELQRQLGDGEPPNQILLNRMLALAEKVQRHFDPQLEEMGNAAS